ncbi:MAG: HIT family protein [Pseudomonadota bacterium]
MSDCTFCKIVADRSENNVTVYEDDYVIGLISLHQKAENLGHVLLLPKAHIENLYELPAVLELPMMSALRLLTHATKKAFSSNGVQIRQNNEAAAGQDVFHLHFHIIPRFKGDAFDDQPYNKLPIDIRKSLALQLREVVSHEAELQMEQMTKDNKQSGCS